MLLQHKLKCCIAINKPLHLWQRMRAVPCITVKSVCAPYCKEKNDELLSSFCRFNKMKKNGVIHFFNP